MSHWYGSLRGVIGFCLVVVSAVLLMSSFAAADSTNSTATEGTTVVITAAIAPVRIVVVDDHNRITEILSNGPGDITPSVHSGNSEGKVMPMSRSISNQYSAIMKHVNSNKTGAIYKFEQTPTIRPGLSKLSGPLSIMSFTVR